MMKKYIYIVFVMFFMGAVSCSEEDITLNPELADLPFDLPQGEEGSLEEQIYSFYERYETFVLYDFDAKEFNNTWGSRTEYWFAPVKEEYKSCVGEVITFMTEEVFAAYPDEFIAGLLPRKLYLVDSLSSSSSASSLENIMTMDNHGMAISRVGEEMLSFTDSDWEELGNEIIGLVLGYIEVPSEFYELPDDHPWFIYNLEEDPEGEYDDFHYTLYKYGFTGADDSMVDYGLFMPHKGEEELSDYFLFIMSTPKTEMDKIFARFELVKERACMLAKFMKEDMEMDLVLMQNSNCPDDPLPENYFDEI